MKFRNIISNELYNKTTKKGPTLPTLVIDPQMIPETTVLKHRGRNRTSDPLISRYF